MPPIRASRTSVDPTARGSIRLKMLSVPGTKGVFGMVNGSRSCAGRLAFSSKVARLVTPEAAADMPCATEKPLSSQKTLNASSGSMPR